MALAIVAVTARAAADAPPPTDAQLEAARALYREAVELHKQGRLADAIDRALEAYRTAATPVTAMEAGNLLVEAGRLVEARDLVRGVALIPVSPHESDKGREARADAATLAASLDGRIPKIAIEHAPAGADVALDGKPAVAGEGLAWQGVDPGPHTIVVRMGEATCTTVAATLAEGEEKTVDLHDALGACAPPAAAPPHPAPPVPADAPRPAIEMHASEPDRSSGLRWGGVVVGGVGLVALGVGAVLALGAKSDYDSVAAECPPRGCTQSAYDVRVSARTRADAATITMIAGGAALAAGVVLFFWPRADTKTASVAIGAGSAHFTLHF